MFSRRFKIALVFASAVVIAGASFAFAESSGTLVAQGIEAIKASKELAIQKRREEALKHAQVTPQPPTPDKEIKDSPSGVGIFENGNPPVSGSVLIATNHWSGYVQGEYRQVWAGALREDPTQGVLVVKNRKSDGRTSLSVTYKTPSRVGAVRIVQADGAKLKLSSQDGSVLTFDASSLQFESTTK